MRLDHAEYMSTAYMGIHEARETYKPHIGVDYRVYAKRLVKHHLLDRLKCERHHDADMDRLDDDTPDTRHQRDSDTSEVREYIDKVITDPIDHMIATWHRIYGYSHSDMAAGLGVSRQTVTKRLARIKDSLRRAL
jgi:RNA polymerase sigma factor (sigma-70 family)